MSNCVTIVSEICPEITDENVSGNRNIRVKFLSQKSANTSGLPSSIYGWSSLHSGKNTSFKNNCFRFFSLLVPKSLL